MYLLYSSFPHTEQGTRVPFSWTCLTWKCRAYLSLKGLEHKSHWTVLTVEGCTLPRCCFIPLKDTNDWLQIGQLLEGFSAATSPTSNCADCTRTEFGESGEFSGNEPNNLLWSSVNRLAEGAAVIEGKKCIMAKYWPQQAAEAPFSLCVLSQSLIGTGVNS